MAQNLIVTPSKITIVFFTVAFLLTCSEAGKNRGFTCPKCDKICNKSPEKKQTTFCLQCAVICDKSKTAGDPWLRLSNNLKIKHKAGPAKTKEISLRGRSIHDDAPLSPSNDGVTWWGRR